jgi:hypothetical protein
MNKYYKTDSGDKKSPVFLAVIILLMIIVFISCSGTEKITFYRAANRADIEIIKGKVGLIRTIYCDIYIEHIDNNTWQHIKKYNTFKGKGTESPSDPCFHFIVENTWNKPIVIDKIEILNKDNISPSEDYSFIKDMHYLEKRYAINISSLLKNRRILSEHILVKDIDFEEDAALYKLYFIAPGDKVSFFKFFSSQPSGKLSKIRVSIKYSELKKVIDFDIGHFDNNDTEEVNRYMEFL